MSEALLEVPVTRVARVTYVGHLVWHSPTLGTGKVHYHSAERLVAGDRVALRVCDSMNFRQGLGRVLDDGIIELRDVVGPREDDHVWRVEPE